MRVLRQEGHAEQRKRMTDNLRNENISLRSITTSMMSQFRIQVTTPESDDSNGGDVDDWLRRLLSYLSRAYPRFRSVGMRYPEYMGQLTTRSQMADLYGVGNVHREEVTEGGLHLLRVVQRPGADD